MSIDRIYYCEGPDCGHEGDDGPGSARTASPPPYLPIGFIEARHSTPAVDATGDEVHHFCSWACLMKYAAAQPIPEWVDV